MGFVSLRNQCLSMTDTSFRRRLELRDRNRILGWATTNPSSLPSRPYSIKVFFAFGYYRLATLGPTFSLFENNQGLRSIKSFMPAQTTIYLWKGRNAGFSLSTGS
ncbi:hypothetical protein NE237_011236 [Protea cynaroides]|uniref:Uncharacterized protein n=1 Tax=Protea cynaroides TaxID=273540 RepID=A0A9Q0JY32_9MAGN|nr:hypothetical protein NE237_011236 [Protea cynaroides]